MQHSDFEVKSLGRCLVQSPLKLSKVTGDGVFNYITDEERVLWNNSLSNFLIKRETDEIPYSFLKAGPRENLFFDPAKTKAAIVTCGGLCPGLNNVIRSLVMELYYRYKVTRILGIQYGYEGLISKYGHSFVDLNPAMVEKISMMGGTFLGSSRGNQDVGEMVDTLENNNINILFCIGGDGTLRGANDIANEIAERGLKIAVVSIPKTIDNDVWGTDQTFGFDSAVGIATDAIDRLHTTANSHKRIMLIELMGHHAGWLTLYAGIAGGGDIILIPELSFSPEILVKSIKKRYSKKKPYSIIVVAEGIKTPDKQSPARYISKLIQDETGFETRDTILGYIQRGGTPSAMDRILATRFGSHAVNLAVEKRFGHMVSLQNNKMTYIPLAEVANKKKLVPKDHSLILKGKSIGTCFGI